MNDGRKDDGEKIRPDLMPDRAYLEVLRVLLHGAGKYGPDNWRRVPDLQRRYQNAARRHQLARRMGEKKDPETGCDHLAHAIASLLFALEDELQREEAPDVVE